MKQMPLTDKDPFEVPLGTWNFLGPPRPPPGDPTWTTKIVISTNLQRQTLSIGASEPFRCNTLPQGPSWTVFHVYYENTAPFGPPEPGYGPLGDIHICIYIYVYMYIYIWMFLCMHIQICICMHIYILFFYFYLCVYIYIHIYIYIDIYIYVYICIYTHI